MTTKPESARAAHTAGVVVGVDGSPASLTAVECAAREAALWRRTLHVVHAFMWPYLDVPLGPSMAGPAGGGLLNEARRFVDDGVVRARAAAPDLVEVRGEVVDGAPAAVLRACSRRSELVVVGDRGLGGFSGLLLGSVAVHLAAHAACPLLVVRGAPDRSGPVLVGVDGSPANEPAVRFAFEEAALRGVPLQAVHAYTHPVSRAAGDMLPLVYDADALVAEETRVLAEALAGCREKYPDVPVDEVLVHAPSRRALIDASGRAQLMVVSTRGRGGFAGLLLGSVSQAVLHHAACPVAVVPHLT